MGNDLEKSGQLIRFFCYMPKKLSDEPKNFGLAMLTGIFLVRPEIFERITEKPDKLSGFFQIISHFLDGFKAARIFPDQLIKPPVYRLVCTV